MIKEFSNMGNCHVEINDKNQDAIYYGSNRNFTVILLADGVSACREAKCGAEIASRAITNLLLKKGDYFYTL